MDKYFVYVIKNPKGLLYKGLTNNLERRLFEHHSGLGKWTKGRGPFELVYFEEHESKSLAQERERYLKSGQGREFLKKKMNERYTGSNSDR